MLNKTLKITISAITFFVASTAIAAPVANIHRSIIPETTDKYYIGTSSPSSLEYNGIFVKDITISGTCTGCGAADGTFSTTSATYFVHSSTTIPKLYTGNTFTGYNSFSSLFATNSSSTYATTTSMAITGLTGILYGNGTTKPLSVAVAGVDYENALTFTFPLNRVTNAISFTGLSTSTDAVIGNIPYFSGVNTFANVATSSLAVGASISSSGTLGSQVGGTASTLSLNMANANTWTALQTFGNASTTLLSVATSFAVTPLTSALTLTGADGTFAEYAGTSCTNQFVRSLSALGAATCATVANTDLANSTISGVALGANLAALTATDGSLTFSGSYDGSTARTVGLSSIAANSVLGTYVAGVPTAIATSSLFQTASASLSGLLSSTDWSTFNGKSGFGYPFLLNATSTTLTLSGGLVGSASSTFLGIHDLKEATVIQHLYPAFTSPATTTTWTATSTWQLGSAMTAETWNYIQCNTDVSFLNVVITDGTNDMDLVPASSTPSKYTLSTNNTFTVGEKIFLRAGTTTTSTATYVSCRVDRTINQ